VQAKLAGRETGLEEVNILEVEIEMLVAKRKQLVEDEYPDAGFRVYGEGAEGGETAGQSSPEGV
jgi:phosphosulfolactate synthase (CoM biosynthesis protein A)